MENGSYVRMVIAFASFWLLIMLTATAAFFAGRAMVQLKVDVAPAAVNVAPAQVTVSAAKPATVDVNVPAPIVNVENKVPQVAPPAVHVENKMPLGPVPVVNVMVDGKKEAPRFVQATPPAVEEPDPDGKVLPPPKK